MSQRGTNLYIVQLVMVISVLVTKQEILSQVVIIMYVLDMVVMYPLLTETNSYQLVQMMSHGFQVHQPVM